MTPYGALPNSTFFGSDYLGAEISGLGLYVDQFMKRLDGKQTWYLLIYMYIV